MKYRIYTKGELLDTCDTRCEVFDIIEDFGKPCDVDMDGNNITQDILESLYDRWQIDKDRDVSPPSYFDNFGKRDEYEEIRKSAIDYYSDDDCMFDFNHSRM